MYYEYTDFFELNIYVDQFHPIQQSQKTILAAVTECGREIVMNHQNFYIIGLQQSRILK